MVNSVHRLAWVIIGVSILLRVLGIGWESLWVDEAYSVYYVTQYSTVELITKLPLIDPHPPVYYLLLDGWVEVFGRSDVALRSLSAVFGIATVVLVYALGAKVVDREAGLVACALCCLSTYQIHYSQEVRMYALLACLTLLSWYYFADLVNGRDWNEHKYSVLAYLLSTVLLGYTHAFGLFVILAQSIYVSILIVHSKIGSPNPSYSRSPGIIRWVSAQTIITALLSPWLVILVSRRGTDAISWISTPNPKGLLMSIHNFFFEYGLHLELFPGKTLDILLMGVFGIFSAIALIVHRENGRLRFGPSPGPLMFSLLFLTPLIGSFVVSILLRPIFIQRYLISGALGLYLLIGAGVSIFVKLNFSGYFSRSSISPFQLSVRHVILTLIILTLFIPIPEYYSEQHHEQWREATQTIEGNASDEAAILFTNNISVHPYRYYSNRDDLTLYSLGEHEAWSSVSARLLEHDEIWVVHSHDSIQIEDGYLDPARQTYGVTEVGQFIGVRIFKLDR